MKVRTVALSIASLLVAGVVAAQLPPDAVMLDKVKVSEAQKSHELDPVTLEAADESLGTFEHNGVTYGMSKADSKDTFFSDPDKYADQHDRARWEYNFNLSMSEIWCPVTDEISPGGNIKWTALDLSWESCCQFCNDTKTDEDFPRALKRLKKRAADAYELMGKPIYTEGASSPVEGAIDLGGPPPAPVAATPEPVQGTESPAAATPEPMQVAKAPEWLADFSGDPTWADPMGKLVERRCVECHRPGGTAPMPMTTVGQMRQWKKNMKTHITLNTMPPWPASAQHSFANIKSLTPAEKELFLKWIDAGYPTGDEPYTIEIGDWAIGEPDHVFTLPEQVLAEDLAEHVAEYEIVTDLDEDKWVVATEVKADVFLALEVDGGPLGAYHSGNSVVELPEGHGFLLKKGQTVKVKVFYMKEAGWEEYPAETPFGLKFAENPSSITKQVFVDRMSNDDFSIPAGSDNTTVSAQFTFPADGHIVSLNPVVRLRGKKVTASVKTPDGKTQEILSIPHFDSMLHFRYQMSEPIEAPKGTVVTVTATYDNSDMNAANPDSSVDVKAGPGGELLEGWLSYTLEGNMKSAENRLNLTDEQLMAMTGTCPKCEAAKNGGAVATD